jgi:hypothetical protein
LWCLVLRCSLSVVGIREPNVGGGEAFHKEGLFVVLARKWDTVSAQQDRTCAKVRAAREKGRQ